jgi:hypothetical protein
MRHVDRKIIDLRTTTLQLKIVHDLSMTNINQISIFNYLKNRNLI